ncbi:MAG: tRNA (N(6)-L-threonylcarbamoyladenosine(37)-C(2))-methylthiotransferase MtaB [Bacteroidales bacterium]|nr:tRNA (N(6)-L-threonylcarbamoyladenosine(37)-C(2))-methylthiotransferase MtaB [Bacteroidales bacterium]
MKKVSFKTLGCRLNQYETDALVTRFYQAGYQVVDYASPADITVINTCTVTNQSDQKSRNTISNAARKNPEGLLVVTGCMANNYKEQLEANEKITYVVDNERKSHIVSLVDAHFKGEVVHPESWAGDVFGFETVDQSLHTRTSIKVQDGCDNFCTYCIVPSVRGRAVSRPLGDILENIRRVVDNGFKEIVITGVNIGRYNFEQYNLESALEKIVELPGDFRIRISSMEPDGFGPDFYKVFQHPRMAPHLHLCIQSGSDLILKKMRRMYTTRSYMNIVETFRKEISDFNFTTDVIVGFPGEEEDDFAATARVVKEARFSHIHTFRYSRRKGTRADRLEEQIEERIKAERSEVIRQISEENRLDYMSSMIGKTERVLIEKVNSKGRAQGYGEHYLPIHFSTPVRTKNMFRDVLLEKVEAGDNPFIQAIDQSLKP